MTTQEVLQQCSVDGLIVRLPEIQLNRNDYLEVKKALELIGGKWRGGKTQGFVFDQNPTELLRAQGNGEQRNLKKEYQFFSTPEDLATEMARTLTHRIMLGDRILEPSAGDGVLIKAFWKEHGHGIKVDCFEAMELNRMKLKRLDSIDILGDDFLQCNNRSDWYDYIIANPPFTKNQDIIHIAKMYQCLKPGGSIVTLSSPSWMLGSQKMQNDFHMWLTDLGADIKEIEPGRFKESGTMIGALLIIIEKPKNRVVDIPVSIENKMNVLKNLSTNEKSKESCTSEEGNKIYQKGIEANKQLISDMEADNEVNLKPEEILSGMIENEKTIQKNLQELKNMLSPSKNNDMNFFEQLATAGNVDMTIRIMQKGDRLTLNVMPGSGQSVTQPIIISGTGNELDAEFFNTIYPQVDEVTGIISNIEEVKKQAKEKQESSAKKPAASKAEKKEKPVKKQEDKKAIPEKVDLFGAADIEPDSETTNPEEDDEQTEENPGDNA